MSVQTGVNTPIRLPHLHLPGRGLALLAGAAVAVAAFTIGGDALSRDSGAGAGSATSLYGNHATITHPSVYYLVSADSLPGLDTATWMNGAPLENVVAIAGPADEEQFLRFIETANSFLLAGGLPGYEVVSFLVP